MASGLTSISASASDFDMLGDKVCEDQKFSPFKYTLLERERKIKLSRDRWTCRERYTVGLDPSDHQCNSKLPLFIAQIQTGIRSAELWPMLPRACLLSVPRNTGRAHSSWIEIGPHSFDWGCALISPSWWELSPGSRCTTLKYLVESFLVLCRF